MAGLRAATRKRMPKGDFAGPGRSFPIEDKKHARLAISGATRSERAGNISPAEEASIKSKARAKLGGKAKMKSVQAGQQKKALVTKSNSRPRGGGKETMDTNFDAKPDGNGRKGGGGAVDGMGAGKGALAVHSSARSTDMHKDGPLYRERY